MEGSFEPAMVLATQDEWTPGPLWPKEKGAGLRASQPLPRGGDRAWAFTASGKGTVTSGTACSAGR